MSREQIHAFEDRHLSGVSDRSDDVSALLDTDYDYMLLGSSWDRRCLALAHSKPIVRCSQLFLPRNVGSGALRIEHDKVLSEFVSTVSQEVTIISDGSEQLDSVFRQIETAILALRKQLDRPLRALVDLSAMARYFSLGAISLALNDNVAEFVDIIYAEGIYGKVMTRSEVPGRAYSGSWDAVAIPRLEGDWFPTHGRHFLVSIGFETTQVARLAERWDPDTITVVSPSPSIDPKYEARTNKANASWMAQFGVGVSSTISANPADAIAAWSALANSPAVDPMRDNIYCLLCGSKPHALGLALFSLSRERPAVMYVRPTAHEEKDIKPNGTFWRFRLRDRTLVAR